MADNALRNYMNWTYVWFVGFHAVYANGTTLGRQPKLQAGRGVTGAAAWCFDDHEQRQQWSSVQPCGAAASNTSNRVFGKHFIYSL